MNRNEEDRLWSAERRNGIIDAEKSKKQSSKFSPLARPMLFLFSPVERICLSKGVTQGEVQQAEPLGRSYVASWEV